MKVFFDFLPVLLFFITFKFSDIYTATAVLIAASILQTAVNYKLKGKVDKMSLATLGMILLFGGITLLLQDEQFIKLKPTAINYLFALILIGGSFTQRNVIERMLGDKLTGMPASAFRNLNMMWIFFFLTAGSVNYYVAQQYSTDQWVNFKLFGLLGMTVVFALLQGIYLYLVARKYDLDFDKEENEG